MAISSRLRGRRNNDEESEDMPLLNSKDFELLDTQNSQSTAEKKKAWDIMEAPVKKENVSMTTTDWIDLSLDILKVLSYLLVFLIVLGTGIIAKGTLFFITSQLQKGRQITHCNMALDVHKHFVTVLPVEERITWLWALLIVVGAPEIGTFLRSVRKCYFEISVKPTNTQFLTSFFVETLHILGVAIFLLLILPNLDVVTGGMVMNALCVVPALLNALTRGPTDIMTILRDILALSVQLTTFVLPLFDDKISLMIPLAAAFISLGWWENYVNVNMKTCPPWVLYLNGLREGIKKSRYYSQRILSLWKIFMFMICIMIYLRVNNDDPEALFSSMSEPFRERNYTAYEVLLSPRNDSPRLFDYELTGASFDLPVSSKASPLWVALIQVASAFICFSVSKFACKSLIQICGFTLPLCLVSPIAVIMMIMPCARRNDNPCVFHNTIPDYLAFEMPPVYLVKGWNISVLWVLWGASQGWITGHTWEPRSALYSTSDKLFAKPWYSGPLIDQSLLLNRTKDDVHIDHDLQRLLVEDVASGAKKLPLTTLRSNHDGEMKYKYKY